MSVEWKQGVKVSLRTFSISHIDVCIDGDGEGVDLGFTSFYENPVKIFANIYGIYYVICLLLMSCHGFS